MKYTDSDTPETLSNNLFTPKTAISYLRVSTRRQAERGEGKDEGFSIPAQREANKKKAASLGAIVVKEFVDRGASAKSADRKDLQDMLEYIAGNKVDYCIIHKLDRLARNRDDDSDITRALKQHGVKLVSTSEAIDDTPSGMLLHGIMASIAEFYSRNLATEVTKGMTQKVLSGGTVGKAPLGYVNIRYMDDMGREVRTVEPDEERAPFVTLAFNMYATGEWTIQNLAEHLAARGLTTRGTPRIPSQQINKSALNKLLVNPYYKGLVRFSGKYHPGKHPKLVDETTWQKVQDILTSHVNGERTREHPHFLKSMVYCASCGSRLIIQYAKSRSGLRYPYFSCSARHRKSNDCKQKSILIERVEELVEQLYDKISLDPELRQDIEAWITEGIDRAAGEFETERREMELEKDKLERRQKKLLETYYADAIPRELFKTEQDTLKKSLDAIDNRIAAHTNHCGEIKDNLGKAMELMEDCGAAYRQAPEHIRRAYNQAIFEKIYIGPDSGAVPEYAEPYGIIFEPEQNENNGTENGGSPVNDRATSLIDLFRIMPNTDRKTPHFFGRCFNNGSLVDLRGLEPLGNAEKTLWYQRDILFV